MRDPWMPDPCSIIMLGAIAGSSAAAFPPSAPKRSTARGVLHVRGVSVMVVHVTDNLDEKCYSLRDFLAVIAAARLARHPLDDVADRLLDMVQAESDR